MAQRKFLALLAAFLVAIIYSANFTVAKSVMPLHVKPFAFIILRVGGAMVLFWLIGFLGPKEKIDSADYPNVIAGAFFGMAINMLAFFEGLSLTSPINAAVIMVTAPIMVLILSFILLQEKLKILKIVGVVIGLIGTSILILLSQEITSTAPNPTRGNLLILVNAASFAIYLVVAKKLTDKYHPFTFLKWMYTIGFIIVMPFGYQQFIEITPETIPFSGYLKIGYVIVFVTFGTYLLNIFAIKELKPTTVAVFIYLQPLFATFIAVYLDSDQLSIAKVLAALLIFLGVYLVNKSSDKTLNSDG